MAATPDRVNADLRRCLTVDTPPPPQVARDKILSRMGEGLGFLQSVVSSSAGYLRYYSNEEGYELDFFVGLEVKPGPIVKCVLGHDFILHF
ncbi:hypothetical protein ZEAMMB73_Zm00001d039431 [Zea mays]|uniref:Uncharacterized protein n=1 Tax=Zea mays TaxID=4577 RepID=A0A1D6MHC9_MAIZE|nr:hypothetical protein ZEAMMB73_Zm00001d039431 [Zea mays]